MPRLRNELTGAVMTVPESTAARLGSEWVAADVPAKAPVDPVEHKAPARSRKAAVTE